MKHRVSWQYDEFQQIGKDYDDPAEVEIYDSTHADFRDVEAEGAQVLDLLALRPGDILIDFGAGTGAFAIPAARRDIRVYAVDVSQSMIAYARAKATKAGVSGIVFSQGGFLTYEHGDRPAEAIVTTFAFHHLPDFWKGVALSRMHGMLKPGGLLYIHDVILEQDHAVENIGAFINKQAAAGGDFLRDDAEGHFREEHSTYDWIIDGLLAHAGFTIVSKSMDEGVIGTYLCRRNAR
jgi:ubiquinone/menaquinone biosynthesis C-methylase UbiE